jgi:hypothetical protein
MRANSPHRLESGTTPRLSLGPVSPHAIATSSSWDSPPRPDLYSNRPLNGTMLRPRARDLTPARLVLRSLPLSASGDGPGVRSFARAPRRGRGRRGGGDGCRGIELALRALCLCVLGVLCSSAVLSAQSGLDCFISSPPAFRRSVTGGFTATCRRGGRGPASLAGLFQGNETSRIHGRNS